MKSLVSILSVSCLIALVLPDAAAAVRTVSKEEVKEAVESLHGAISNGDKKTFKALLSDDVEVTFGVDRNTRSQLLETITAPAAGRPKRSYEFSNWSIRQIDDVVLVSYHLSVKVKTKAGEERQRRWSDTMVWQERAGKLVMIQAHAQEIPLRKSIDVDSHVLKDYVGVYEAEDSGLKFEVRVEGGSLYIARVGVTHVGKAWQAESPTEFYYPGGHGTVEFVRGKGKQVTHYLYREPGNPPAKAKRVK